MNDYRQYIPALSKLGYNKKENISDFWFLHKETIAKYIFGNTGNDDQFSLLVRWESSIGKECTRAIKAFIDDKQQINSKELNDLSKNGIITFKFAEIDFNSFKFTFENKDYDLHSFSALFPTSYIYNVSDLRGINLSKIKINNSILKNAMLAQSDFSNSNLQQVELKNINFVKANFTNARLVSVRMDNDSTFGNADFTNAFLNAISLNDRNLGDGIVIKEIPYSTLIKKTIVRDPYTHPKDHTVFLSVQTKEITNYNLLDQKKYIEWYMTVSSEIVNSGKSRKKKFFTLFQIIISKYWSSYRVFGGVTIATILLLSIVFHFTSSSFKIPSELLPIGYIDSIYFVVVTFTTLGYGDITPINWLGQFFVITTALTGYLFLGIFIYLLSKKLN